jgi:hypothetical protein
MNRLMFALIIFLSVSFFGCIDVPVQKGSPPETKSASGVTKAEAKVKTGADGLTVEQGNVKKRIELENTPGAIKHLYIISAMSGQVIIYSTVDGKVTSSGKRLTPTKVTAQHVATGRYNDDAVVFHYGEKVNIGGNSHRTSEVLQDDGTYGTSIHYLYWWDTRGQYHQHYVSGGQIIHVADQPMPVKNIIINLESTPKSEPEPEPEPENK